MSIFLDMETKTAATQILSIWHDSRTKKATADECRERMASLKATLGDAEYEKAKFVALVNDR